MIGQCSPGIPLSPSCTLDYKGVTMPGFFHAFRKVKTLNLLIVRSFTECSLPTLCVCVCFLKGKQSNCSHWPRSCLPVTHTQCLCVADGLSVQCAGALASCPAFFTQAGAAPVPGQCSFSSQALLTGLVSRAQACCVCFCSLAYTPVCPPQRSVPSFLADG